VALHSKGSDGNQKKETQTEANEAETFSLPNPWDPLALKSEQINRRQQ
jgi:hypothetical protein